MPVLRRTAQTLLRHRQIDEVRVHRVDDALGARVGGVALALPGQHLPDAEHRRPARRCSRTAWPGRRWCPPPRSAAHPSAAPGRVRVALARARTCTAACRPPARAPNSGYFVRHSPCSWRISLDGRGVVGVGAVHREVGVEQVGVACRPACGRRTGRRGRRCPWRRRPAGRRSPWPAAASPTRCRATRSPRGRSSRRWPRGRPAPLTGDGLRLGERVGDRPAGVRRDRALAGRRPGTSAVKLVNARSKPLACASEPAMKSCFGSTAPSSTSARTLSGNSWA